MCFQANIIAFGCCLPSYWIVVVTPNINTHETIIVPYSLGDFLMQSITLASLTIVVD
jgi:hypothetical protein